MDETKQLRVWPDRLPASLAGLYEHIATQLGDVTVDPLETAAAFADLAEARDGNALVAVPEAALATGTTAADVVTQLLELSRLEGARLVLVVTGGALGTDAADLTSGVVGAGAVALARSLAVRREGASRANVVAVPEALFGIVSGQRGPLRQEVEVSDVAAAIALLLSPDGRYVNGQVLFVDGGRHLFSSMTA